MFVKQEQEIIKKKKFKNIIIYSLPSYKTLPLSTISTRALKLYSPFLLHIVKSNHQELKGAGGGKAHLDLEKPALKVATSVRSLSRSCP